MISSVVLIVVVGSFLLSVAYLSNHDASENNNDNNNDDDHPSSSLPQTHHRRLISVSQEHRTLSPASKATIMLANEIAISHAKAKGQFVYEKKADPFQVMQARRVVVDIANNNAKVEEAASGPNNNNNNNRNAILEEQHKKEAAVLEMLQSFTSWNETDPLLADTNIRKAAIEFADIESLPRIGFEFEPQVEYLGVMVDAGRNHFPIDWWNRLLAYLYKLRYNMIHLRLTDDERFAVRLDSYPQLANFTIAAGNGNNNEVYTPKELTDLVALAKNYNITIIPEINLPLRAASWAGGGMPDLIVGCPNFICDVAHYVPLNIHHKEFPTILEGVLGEVLSIFDQPPMLHLGGTLSLKDADGCFEEAASAGSTTKFGSTSQYLETFQTILSSVLLKLSYPESQVIRMESEDHPEDDNMATNTRVGGIVHRWVSLQQQDDGGKETDVAKSGSGTESLISTGIDFAVDHGLGALNTYRNTLHIMQLEQKPKGFIVGTLTLGPEFWLEQNILARLISVVLGASHGSSKSLVSETTFMSSYASVCQSILTGKSHPLCQLDGYPTRRTHHYLEAQLKISQDWRRSLCSRLAASTNERVFQPYLPMQNYAAARGNELFWKSFHRPPKPHEPVLKKGAEPVKLLEDVKEWKHSVQKTGIILDFANSRPSYMKDLKEMIRNYVAPLGFDLLQIRLADDFDFALDLDTQSLSQSVAAIEHKDMADAPTTADLKDLVDVANKEWNMEVIPEISVTTNSGGWVNGGFLVKCPKLYCKDGTSIPNDIREPQFLALVYSVLRELQEIFGSSSYFHLGSDERVGSLACYEEDGLKANEDPPFGSFEAKLKKMLLMLGIQPESVIRWDNDEQLSYEDRVGGITHYRSPMDPESPPDVREGGEPFFMTVDLLEGTIYNVYRQAKSFVEFKPLGIMGEIRTLFPRIWKEQHMGMRLIALLLGVSTRGTTGKDALSHQEFIKEAIKLCKAIKFPLYRMDPDCKAVETILKKEKVKVTDDDAAGVDEGPRYPVATEQFREIMCQTHTRPRKTMIMKEDVVVVDKN